MSGNQLKFVFEGSSYSQTLTLKYENSIVFHGVADDLVTSANGDLGLRLNFGSSQVFFHSLKLAGSFVVLVPFIAAPNTQGYLESVKGAVLAWPLEDFTNLWKELRYDDAELAELVLASPEDLLVTWLLSSNCCRCESLDAALLADAICDSILAESGDETPSIRDVINQLSKGDVQLNNPERLANAHSAVLIAYVDNGEVSSTEWKAMSEDRQWCLLNESFGMLISKPSEGS